ncbi:MAG: ferrous iron transporter B [Candidatus Kapabacteria bacterium]|nr:ferrous iron transporter B [Candidatus Kapabacteria bacterium]MCX7936350.1 ferrous iron transporter B [Chlorobiota bacterium]
MHVAVVGVPNSGKTTLYNALTGLRKKVANYPGVTVEPSIGAVRGVDSSVVLVDLPGIYSLSPKSVDESVTRAVLGGTASSLPPIKGILLVLDATNLERGLFLFSQLAELGKPMVVALTMVDEIKRRGSILDDILLESLLGVDVYPIVGTKGLGIERLRNALATVTQWRVPSVPLVPGVSVAERVAWARGIVAQVLRKDAVDERTERIDQIALHPIWGTLLFVLIMGIIFQSIFTWSAPMMDWIDYAFNQLRTWMVGDTLVPPLWIDFLANGVIAGVGSVLVFAPQIFVLMLLVTFLEDSGYLARATFLVDRLLGIFGLQGRSFIPLLSSYACAIPGILSARIIPSHAERMATILVAPLMTCSARLPVYTLLIGAFVPSVMVGGLISLQALVLAALYVGAGVIGLVIAWLLRKTVFVGEQATFFIEFPPYRMPYWRNLLTRAFLRMQDFIQTAGTVILAISIVLWALGAFPRLQPQPTMEPQQYRRAQLEQSYAAQLGKVIAPLFAPMHFDWRITLGIIGSFAAREVFVSVMGQLVSGTDDDPSNAHLRQALQQSMDPAVAFAVIAFYMFALQCMSTIAVLRRETGSWGWAAFAFLYMLALAYVAAAGTYNIARLFLS